MIASFLYGNDAVELTDEQRGELQRRVGSRTGHRDDAQRAQCIPMLAEGWARAQIREALE